MSENGLTVEEHDSVHGRAQGMTCPNCKNSRGWRVLGGEHFEIQSAYRRTASVACKTCGYLAFFILEVES